MMEYYSCECINGGICFVEDKIMFCSKGNSAKNLSMPVLVDNFKGEKIDFNKIFTERENAIALLKQGDCPEYCKDCIGLEKRNWFENARWFEYVLFSTWTACNCSCLYCNCNPKPGQFLIKDINKYEREQKDNSFNLIPTVYDMISNGYISRHTTIDFAGGEPTIYPYFEDMVKLLLEAKIQKIIVHTNAIRFSKVIQSAIKSGVMDIVVSTDSGSKQGYEQIKRVAAYDRVWSNIKKYASVKPPHTKNEVALKYVIMPGINDSKEELELWIKQGIKAGVNKFILNADNNFFFKSNKHPEVLKRIVNLTDFFVDTMQTHCCKWKLYTNCLLAYKELGIEFVERKA